MKFYYLRENLFDAALRPIQLGGHVDDKFPGEFLLRETWLQGSALDAVPAMPLFTFDPSKGSVMVDAIDHPLPLMSKRLLGAIDKAGVKTMQTFPFPIAERGKRGPSLDHYRVVNVTCAVDSLDDIASKRGARMFIVRGGPEYIVVNAPLERALLAAKLIGVLLQRVEDFDGD